MERVWREYGESMERVWREYGESMERVWREYGESMERVWFSETAIMQPSSTLFFENICLHGIGISEGIN